MQFAGQRTDADLNVVGEPVNILVSLTDEILPDPGAIMVTGITPQKTREEGYSEADFLKLIHQQVIQPGTIVVGFNSIRFDDEFMRHTFFRNFYDPYEWQWKDDCSRWDLLDVVRMTRALRPEGIQWPTDSEGNPTNRLELITAQNGLEHSNAHNALSDVIALIAVTKMIRDKQPKLYEYLLSMRSKQAVAKLVNLDNPQPFVYASGRYPRKYLHTTVAFPIAPGSRSGTAIVYDLREDPEQWMNKSVKELKEIRFAKWEARQQEGFVPLPAKELAYNKCPAVAPLGVLDSTAQERLQLDIATIERNLAKLRTSGLGDKLSEVFASGSFPKAKDVDGSIYDGFVNDADKTKMRAIRAADAKALTGFQPEFSDERLVKLLLRYKARNYGQILAEDERAAWEEYRAARLQADLPQFTQQLQKLSATTTDENRQFLLQELQLWAESIAPIE